MGGDVRERERETQRKSARYRDRVKRKVGQSESEGQTRHFTQIKGN